MKERTILLVEDNPDHVILALRVFEKYHLSSKDFHQFAEAIK